MNEAEERELEALLERELSEHLSAVLEPHAGRAAGAFLAHVGMAHWAEGAAGRLRMWWWALGAGALAACLTVGWLVQELNGPAPRVPGPGIVQRDPPPARDARQEVIRSVSWQTLEEGTVVLDDVPLHRVRRKVIETEQWYDPEHQTRIEVTTPREEVIFVGMRQQ